MDNLSAQPTAEAYQGVHEIGARPYRFKGDVDGAAPRGRLLDVNGTLYGETLWGGSHRECFTMSEETHGCGTVFGITTSGKKKILYQFTGGADGANPDGGLIEVNGTLYGVATGGGSNQGGTLFSLTLGGVETVLHSFSGAPDGAGPHGDLILVKNTLYGTTQGGGSISCGLSTSYPLACGTVFAYTLP
jgi:uncharacterized repeat protein (TIGR03803 family)